MVPLPFSPALLGELWVPGAVVEECLRDPVKPAASEIADAMERGRLISVELADPELLADLESLLDDGEAQAITLALQRRIPILIDERLGRSVAKRRGLTVLGSLAVALKAKQSGVVEKISPLIDRLELHGYCLSSGLKRKVLQLCGE